MSLALFLKICQAKLHCPMLLRVALFVALSINVCAASGHVIDVGNAEDGSQSTGLEEIFHDEFDSKSLHDVLLSYDRGEFTPLHTAGSTGLKKGAFWSHFALRNTTDQTLKLNLEYIDHQLIALEAYDRPLNTGSYRKIADLSLAKPFSHRPVLHNRFVVVLNLAPYETRELFVKYSSDKMGFVFPSMRIWQPEKLIARHTQETSGMAFLFGGFFLMSIFALVAGFATKEKTFYAYSVYSISKISVWATILGYTHQYILQNNYHWSYMSISGAVTIFFGLFFARVFLQTRKYTPKLDYVLLFMMANAVFLLFTGLLKETPLTIISITIALLLYPVLAVIGILRWRQGLNGAAVFTFAWSLLIFGLVVQALRDMGLVQHNILNYYWPAVASFWEMLVIMAAMGIKVETLRTQKEFAEQRYRTHLEQSKIELEGLVHERTKALAEAKQQAEHEARTDALTGIHNRRSFFIESNILLEKAKLHNRALSMLMLDIDYFKKINDNYGHGVGDQTLIAFSKTLERIIRGNDIFGRVGGEEFALLLSDDTHGAVELAERLREAITTIRVATPEGELSLSASIGLAHFDAEDSLETLLMKADNALYAAKEKGRNCVVELACPLSQNPSSAAPEEKNKTSIAAGDIQAGQNGV